MMRIAHATKQSFAFTLSISSAIQSDRLQTFSLFMKLNKQINNAFGVALVERSMAIFYCRINETEKETIFVQVLSSSFRTFQSNACVFSVSGQNQNTFSYREELLPRKYLPNTFDIWISLSLFLFLFGAFIASACLLQKPLQLYASKTTEERPPKQRNNAEVL